MSASKNTNVGALFTSTRQALRDEALHGEGYIEETIRLRAALFAAEARVTELEAVLLVVDDALVNGDAPMVADWHRDHVEESAEDCLVCIVRAALDEGGHR